MIYYSLQELENRMDVIFVHKNFDFQVRIKQICADMQFPIFLVNVEDGMPSSFFPINIGEFNRDYEIAQ